MPEIITPPSSCPVPLRFWDRDRLAAVHGPEVWHRWAGRWTNYLFAEGARPFADDAARGRLWYPAEPDAVRFIPYTPADGSPLPGTPVTVHTVDGLVLKPARSAVPYVQFPPGHRRGVHEFAPAREVAQRLAEEEGLAPAERKPSVSLRALRATLLALLDGERQATASFHRAAGRIYARCDSVLGTMTYVWILSQDAA